MILFDKKFEANFGLLLFTVKLVFSLKYELFCLETGQNLFATILNFLLRICFYFVF